MAGSYEEKRRYKRIYFSKEDGVQGWFIFPAHGIDSHKAAIMDLSESGLCFSLEKGEISGIKIGDKIILREMLGPEKIRFESEISLQVRWIVDHDILQHHALGCEFMVIDGEVREKIRKTIHSGTVK